MAATATEPVALPAPEKLNESDDMRGYVTSQVADATIKSEQGKGQSMAQSCSHKRRHEYDDVIIKQSLAVVQNHAGEVIAKVSGDKPLARATYSTIAVPPEDLKRGTEIDVLLNQYMGYIPQLALEYKETQPCWKTAVIIKVDATRKSLVVHVSDRNEFSSLEVDISDSRYIAPRNTHAGQLHLPLSEVGH